MNEVEYIRIFHLARAGDALAAVAALREARRRNHWEDQLRAARAISDTTGESWIVLETEGGATGHLITDINAFNARSFQVQWTIRP